MIWNKINDKQENLVEGNIYCCRYIEPIGNGLFKEGYDIFEFCDEQWFNDKIETDDIIITHWAEFEPVDEYLL